MIGRFEKGLLGLATLLTAATGILFGAMKYLLRPPDPFSVINHPWQPALLSAHVLAAPLLLFGMGLIAREHILGRYRDPRARKGRQTGILASVILIPMVASGYLVQVLVSRQWRSAVGIFHLGAGLVFLAAYGAHRILAARNGRRGELPVMKGRDPAGVSEAGPARPGPPRTGLAR